MKFRDIFMFTSVVLIAVAVGWYASSGVEGTMFKSNEINRDDARRESTTLLSTDCWVEFQIVPNANNFRLMTNAALSSTDAPDFDLSNPRLGWRYAIEYELLDSNRNLIEKSNYHFRSAIRQLWDADAQKNIYPLFFGKSSLVSTQTRTMQIGVERNQQRVAILRARLVSTDPEIQEVVVRALARVERAGYEQRKTWNRMSDQRRENISKYCVYGHELLNVNERNSLLRWRWARCPMVGEFEKRYLFFIGDEDDQEVRDEQIPLGVYSDLQTRATIPVPEGNAKLRLEFTTLDNDQREKFVDVIWFGHEKEERTQTRHRIDSASTSICLDVHGGLLEIIPSTRLVVRAFWEPLDDLARQTIDESGDKARYLSPEVTDELEITPGPIHVRTFLADDLALDYSISHYQDQPTPCRIQIRYPLGVIFNNQAPNLDSVIGQSSIPTDSTFRDDLTSSNAMATAGYQFLDRDGVVVDSGEFDMPIIVSAYDWLTTNGMRDRISDPNNFYFLIPTHVSTVRIISRDFRLLVNAYVRPNELPRTIRVPEDYQPYSRVQSLNRSWYGVKPVDHLTKIQKNRSFAIATQLRPSPIDQEMLDGEYEWIRYQPSGPWIGKQMLIPQLAETELRIRDQAIGSTYFELTPGVPSQFRKYRSGFVSDQSTPKLVFVGAQAPGHISIRVNGSLLKDANVLARRGEISFDGFAWPDNGIVEIATDNATRLFLSGVELEGLNRFLKRTAQQLANGELEFNYTKLTSEDELLTLQMYRSNPKSVRCKIRVRINLPVLTQQDIAKPQTTWTLTDRIYDLQALAETPSVMLDHAGQVDTGHRCFIKLGKELPPGEYKIRVERIGENSDAFAILYRTIPGSFPVRKLTVGKNEATNP